MEQFETSYEEVARRVLEAQGIPHARDMSAGDVVGGANRIREYLRGLLEAGHLLHPPGRGPRPWGDNTGDLGLPCPARIPLPPHGDLRIREWRAGVNMDRSPWCEVTGLVFQRKPGEGVFVLKTDPEAAGFQFALPRELTLPDGRRIVDFSTRWGPFTGPIRQFSIFGDLRPPKDHEIYLVNRLAAGEGFRKGLEASKREAP